MKTYPRFIREDRIKKPSKLAAIVTIILFAIMSASLGYTTSEVIKLKQEVRALKVSQKPPVPFNLSLVKNIAPLKYEILFPKRKKKG